MPDSKIPLHLHNTQSRNIFPFSMEGCVAYIPFWQEDMQGSTLLSYDPNHRSCTVTGATWGGQGRVFDGNDKIALTSITVGNPATVVAWVKKSSITAAYAITGDDASQNDYSLYSYGAAAGAENDIYLWTGLGNNYVMFDQIGLTTAWTMITVTISGQTPRLYLDTTDKGAGAVTGTLGNMKIDTIGAKTDGTLAWVGTLGEVLGYSRAFSAAEIQNVYEVTRWRYAA